MSKQDKKSKDKEMEVFLALCRETFFPPINLSNYQIPAEILKYIPERIAVAYNVIPISYLENVLVVAMSDPLDSTVIDSLHLVTEMEISPVLALKRQIAETIKINYSLREETKEVKPKDEIKILSADMSSFQTKKFNLEEITKLSIGTKIVTTVNMLLDGAVKTRASDIHIEPAEKDVRIRYRVDGMLLEIKRIEKRFQEAVIARIKIMSLLDITQHRIPQDGRFGFNTHNQEIDVRVSMLPTEFGEKIVLRLLNKSSINLEVEKLGFSPYALKAFQDAVSKPLGMILLTGPTGSGKTTTLYTLLNGLNMPNKSLVTIEDPVEYNLKGVSQAPVKHEIGLDFASILRATLRQSPDIIMVGEIRDSETVDIVMKAALTGHIVFSTLHTNDAPSAITRLFNMGAEPFIISFSLNMVAAQRLVRKICEHCKEPYTVDLTDAKEIPSQYRKKDATLYRGKGCKECKNVKYKGRVAVVEALVIDSKIREMIIKRASTDEIRDYAHDNCGMKTLREDAMDKAFRGETTLEEVIRVTTEF